MLNPVVTLWSAVVAWINFYNFTLFELCVSVYFDGDRGLWLLKIGGRGQCLLWPEAGSCAKKEDSCVSRSV